MILIGNCFILSRWCNGLAHLQQYSCYQQGPRFESHLRPVEYFTCNKVYPLNDRTSTLKSVPQQTSSKLSGKYVKHPTKNKFTRLLYSFKKAKKTLKTCVLKKSSFIHTCVFFHYIQQARQRGMVCILAPVMRDTKDE